MADECLTPEYNEGPCHCDHCDPGRLRDDRIENYYQGWGAREMAERIVDLEDEIGADVNGICTGMHADVAEAWAEIERLRAIVADYENRINWFTTCKGCVGLLDAVHAETCRVDRYRLAWLSARRRAADEANLAMEALELKRQEISRLRAALDEARKTTHGPRLECVGPDGEGGEVWRVVDDSKKP